MDSKLYERPLNRKFGREEFSRIAPLAAVDTIITDEGVNLELVAEVEAAGTDVIRAALQAESRTA